MQIIAHEQFIDFYNKNKNKLFISSEAVWMAAEKAILQTTPLAALLSPAKSYQQEDQSLTRQELQSLKSMLGDLLSQAEEVKNDSKSRAAYFYQRAEKNTPRGQANFKELNFYRDDIRATDKFIKKYSKIQYKIKKILSN